MEPNDKENAVDDDINLFLAFFIPFILLWGKFIPKVAELISKRFFRAENKEVELIRSAVDIKKEMSTLSMVDEFAKYAKLQRRLNQITLDLEARVGSRKSLQSKLTKLISNLSYGLIGIIYLSAILFYGTETAVAIVPWYFFYPLTAILSFPTGIQGAISIPMYTLLMRNVVNLVPR